MQETIQSNQKRRRLYQMPDTSTDQEPAEIIEGEWLPPENTSPDRMAFEDASRRRDDAMQIVSRHAAYSSMAGLVPIPVLDNFITGSIHLQMARDLVACYELPFSSRHAILQISILLWGLGIPSLARWSGHKLLAGIPLIGGLLGWAGSAAMTGAVTYAVGKVLVYHFATGGNLLNFDAEKARSFFVASYKEALSTA